MLDRKTVNKNILLLRKYPSSSLSRVFKKGKIE
jgi:hypothetical protein